jgi:putative tRNA adenosine deaminase-associated protein
MPLLSGGTVSYFAAAVVRGAAGWSASQFSLSHAADVEDVAERLRDVDPDAELSLLFVEGDEAYLVILRLDEGEDLRVFGSDAAFAEESRYGALLLGDIKEPALELDEAVVEVDDVPVSSAVADADDEPPPIADADPVGDPELLADLGVPAGRLLALCAQEGMLPSDITAEVCQAIGCGDEVEELREA